MNGAERKAGAAKYHDGDYDFYFKNGAHIHGDCDGYSSDIGGKTTIYEWFQSEINKWEKRLLASGVKPEMYRTSSLHYCWARFDTKLLVGAGWEGNGTNPLDNDTTDVLMNDGQSFRIEDMHGLHYARANGRFGNGSGWLSQSNQDYFKDIIKNVSDIQEKRNTPALLFVFQRDVRKADYLRGRNTLEKKGVPIIESAYVLIGAENVSWFAYDIGQE